MRAYLKTIALTIVPLMLATIMLSIINGTLTAPVVGDIWAQYIPFSQDFWMNLFTGNLSSYSFQWGLGTETLTTYVYYALSPISFLLFLFKGLPLQLNVIISISAGAVLSAVSMLKYTKYKFPEGKYNELAAIAYALCGTGVVFISQSIWLYSIGIYPLIMLYFEKTMKSNNTANDIIYTLLLASSIISNFLMGFITCLSIVIFFFTLKFENRKDFFMKLSKIAARSIIAVGLSAPVLYLVLKNIISGEHQVVQTVNKTNWTTFFSNILPVNMAGMTNYTSLFPYVATLFIFGTIGYFSSKETNVKEKIRNGIRLGLLTISLLIYPVQCMWYGFDSPDGMHGRMTFVFVFIVVTLALKWLNTEPKQNKTQNIIAIMFYTVCVAAGFTKAGILGLFVIVIVFFVCKKNQKHIQKVITTEIIVTAIFSMLVIGTEPITENSYLKDGIQHERTVVDDIEKMPSYNETAYLSQYNSFVHNGAMHFINDMGGYVANSRYCISVQDSEVLISAVGTKQMLVNNEFVEYKYPLEIGYIVNDDIKNYKRGDDVNEFIEQTTGIKNKEYSSNAKYEIKGSNSSEGIEIIFKENIPNGKLRMYFSLSTNNTISYSINGESYIKTSELTQIKLTNIRSGDKIIFKTENNSPYQLKIQKFNSNVFNEWYEKIAQNQMEDVSIDKNKLKGTIKTQDGGLLLITVPYTKNMTAYIDGTETKILPLCEKTFIGIKVSEGEHKILLKYSDAIFKYTFIFPILSILSILVIIKKRKTKTCK